MRVVLSWIYGLVVWVRNFLYDKKLLKSVYVDKDYIGQEKGTKGRRVATICVGNLAVGGTGKTPHTELLARDLSERYKVAILSRGYKRKTRGFRLAEAGVTAREIGDEPMQMWLGLRDRVRVAVCEDRVAGVRELCRRFDDLEVIVLDDAYQHRHLRCGYYILLTAADNLYVRDHLLPRGKLREQRHGSLRANAVVVTKCKDDIKPIEKRLIDTELRLPTYQDLYFSKIRYGALQPIVEDVTIREDEIRKPLVVTGIANAEGLEKYVEGRFGKMEALRFGDHHAYSKKDVDLIGREMDKRGCDCVVTTAKDAVRLVENEEFMERFGGRTLIQPITVEIDQRDEFLKKIVRYIDENNRKRL